MTGKWLNDLYSSGASMEATRELISTVWYYLLEVTKMIMADFYETLLTLQLRYFKRAQYVQVETETCHSYNELYEILSWMPAKAIVKFSSSLCKGLSKIHLDQHFVWKQCIRSGGQDNGFFLQPKLEDQDGIIPNMIESHVLPWQTPSAFGIPHDCIDYFLDYGGRILSSSNGLLLLGRQGFGTVRFRFRLCNPATMVWVPLSTPNKGFKFTVDEGARPLIECYPWAHDVVDGIEFPDDYTIALPVECGSVYNVEIHLLLYSNGSWEEELCNVSIEGRVVRHDMPVAIFSTTTRGLIVHYLCDSNNGQIMPEDAYMEPFIAAFDTRAKTLGREIKLPDGAWDVKHDNYWKGSYGKLWLFKWNDTSMCLVRWLKAGGEVTAWVLEDYGESRESWRRVMNKTEKDLLGFDGREWVTEVGVVSGKGVLLATQTMVYVYVVDLEEEDKGRLEVVGPHGLGWDITFMSYANTLRPISVHM